MRLSDWFKSTKTRRNAFARSIGVTAQTVTGYCNGSFQPSMKVASEIARVTGGAVTADDFMMQLREKMERDAMQAGAAE